MASETTIAIVGGGAAGALCAIALLRHPSHLARHVVILEPSARLGAGIAYSTESDAHLLNVRASGMSALADEPGHFCSWAQGRGLPVAGPEFLPRRHYGPYLRDTLSAAQAAAPAGTTLDHRRVTVTGVRQVAGPERIALTLDDGGELAADHVVLATGHRPASPRWLPEGPGIVADPWRPGAIRALRHARSVLIVGTGLTALDVVLTLRDEGFQGSVHLVSTHGLLPAAHHPQVLPQRPPAIRPGDGLAHTALGLVRALRADAAVADDWRQTVDSIRPVTVDLWRGLPPDERRRALRHGARYWEVRRHRMAPEVATAVDAWRQTGRLSVERGRVIGIAAVGPHFRVTVASHGSRSVRDVDVVVSCVGPSADPADDTLLAGMLATGAAVRHPLALGLDVEPDGRVRRADGSAWSVLWAMGSLRKGAEWESTAVPELRLHAQAIASSLLGAT